MLIIRRAWRYPEIWISAYFHVIRISAYLHFRAIKWRKKYINPLLLGSWLVEGICFYSENETIFSFFTEDDPYFPTEQQVMLNFQVNNIDETIQHLEQMGVLLVNEIEDKAILQEESVKHPALGELPLDQWIEQIYLHEQTTHRTNKRDKITFRCRN